MKRPLSFVAATVFTATSSSTALADIGPPVVQCAADGPAPAVAGSCDLSADEIHRFRTARRAVGIIQRDFAVEAGQPGRRPEQTVDLEREARRRMRAAIEDAGLEVARYYQLQLLTLHDAELRSELGPGQ